jgi:hypothetical protein
MVGMSATEEMLGEYDVNMPSISAVLGDDLVLVFPDFLYGKVLACDYSD